MEDRLTKGNPKILKKKIPRRPEKSDIRYPYGQSKEPRHAG